MLGLHPSRGTFVLIEGNMTSENGTIVYFDQHMRYHEKVYEEINDNEIGNVLQDMYLPTARSTSLPKTARQAAWELHSTATDASSSAMPTR